MRGAAGRRCAARGAARPAGPSAAQVGAAKRGAARRARGGARRALALAVCGVFGAVPGAARALDWDTGVNNGTVDGGSGAWDLLTPNWTADGGASNGTWGNGQAAVFGGAAGGVVTVGAGGVTANSLNFDTTGSGTFYTIQGLTPDDLLTLTGPIAQVNASATIAATLGGTSGLFKFGAGTLTLSAAGNPLSGGIQVYEGALQLASAGAAGSNTIVVHTGGNLVAAGTVVSNSIVLNGGSLGFAAGDAAFTGAVSVDWASAVVADQAGRTLRLGGVLGGASALTFDVSNGSAVVVDNLANFDGSANTFTGNVSVIGTAGTGGSAWLAHGVTAGPGRTLSASGGSLLLGGVAGAPVTILDGGLVVASGAGTVTLAGRAAGPGVGVIVSGDLLAQVGGRITVGDNSDDAAGIQLNSTADLTADGGTIALAPRAPLSLNTSTVGSLNVWNGGVLSVGGTGDTVLEKDLGQSGAWTLAGAGTGTFRIAAGSQDTTEGLTLRGEGGVIRYEADALTVSDAAANGSARIEPRGGTVDINADAPGKMFVYAPGYVLSGWGQVGTSASNQVHVIPFEGATFYANGPVAQAPTLAVVGAIDESAGTKAALRIGDNAGLALAVPNTSDQPYDVGGLTVDGQSNGGVARLIAAGGAVRVAGAAISNPQSRLRLEARSGGTMITDLPGNGGVLLSGGSFGASLAVALAGGTFITTAPTFALNSTQSAAGTGAFLALPPGASTPTSLVLHGLLDLNGQLGATLDPTSAGAIRLDAGETLTMLGGGDLPAGGLWYGGEGTGAATLEVNAPGATVRLKQATPISTPYGPFAGTAAFTATAGTLQVDAADANTVSITGVNALSVDRTSDATSNPTVLGTLTLNGGAFQVGAGAATITVQPGALLLGRGTIGHTNLVDTFINLGTVRAAAGGLTTVSGTSIRGSGTWDPDGQTILLAGRVDNVAGGTTRLTIAGSNGGTVQLGLAGNTFTGGVLIDGSTAGSPGAGPTLRLTTTGGFGAGTAGLTLRNGNVSVGHDVDLNYGTIPVVLSGTGTSIISWGRLNTNIANFRQLTLGTVTLGNEPGQALNFAGLNAYKLSTGLITVGTAGASINMTGGGLPQYTGGGLAVNGDLSLSVAGVQYNVNALSGGGTITRTVDSGTIVFNRAANGFTGHYITSGGTTNFSASNTLGAGRFTFTRGQMNVTNGGSFALNGATGVMSQPATNGASFNLYAANALSGASIEVAGGTMNANIAGALGTGTVALTGGRVYLRSDPGATFGGTINVAGPAQSDLVLDRGPGGSGTGGTHVISALNFYGQKLNLYSTAGYGLQVTGPITASGTGEAVLQHDAPGGLSAPALIVNGTLDLGGGGPTTIGQLGGTGLISRSGTGTLELTNTAMPGFAAQVHVTGGTLNLRFNGAVAGGTVTVDGGTLNLLAGNALAGTPVSMSSGFLNAAVPAALSNHDFEVTNGTLAAAATDALTGSTVRLRGGNLTATAPGALNSAAVLMDASVLALRNDVSAAFGGDVTVNLTGTNSSTLSAAPVTFTEFDGPAGNTLSINSLTLVNAPTLNITGASEYVLAVAGAVTLPTSGAGVTFNATAADAVFQGATTGPGPITKTGQRKVTFGGGGSHGATTVKAGTLAANGNWTTPGVTVGGVDGPATLELGGTGVAGIGSLVVNAGTLRVAKGLVTDAIPTSLAINAGGNGDLTLEYAGLRSGTARGQFLSGHTINMAASAAARVLTLSAASGSGTNGTLGSTLLFEGSIVKTGTNALSLVGRADAPAGDALGLGALARAPSRLVIGINHSLPFAHGAGIVIGRGAVSGGAASAYGNGTAALQLALPDSTVGTMVADNTPAGTGVAFSRWVSSGTSGAARARLGAFFNPANAAATQIVDVALGMRFEWNDPAAPLAAYAVGGNAPAGMANSSWNGLLADPGTVLRVNAGAVLDNILTVSGTNALTVAPVYVGGGGTVRLESGFTQAATNLAAARGLGGAVGVLDGTTLESRTTGKHFDAIDLRGGSYAVAGVNQTWTGPLTVYGSPWDPARVSGLVTSNGLTLSGTGANAFKVTVGQTVAKSGTATLTLAGDQAHEAGSVLRAEQGTTQVNTDAGRNPAGGAAVNNLGVTATNDAVVNFAATQHLAQVVVGGVAVARLTAGATAGSRLIEATGVSVGGAGKLDLTNGSLIVDYGGPSPLGGLRAMLATGYNAGGARWGGSGIVSTTAAADATAGTSVGYAEASALFGAGGGTFLGEAVDGSAVLVRYTRNGDADLDGTVGFADLLKVAQNYDKIGQVWSDGDFDYDGSVAFADLLVVAQNYETALPAALPADVPVAGADFQADWQAALTMVPEPGAATSLLFAGAALLGRRRRAKARQTPSR